MSTIVVPFGLIAVLMGSARGDDPALTTPLPSTSAEAPSREYDDQLTRARAVVAAAERLFVAGHYGVALAEYSRAYAILEGHPRQYWVLHNLAACNERMLRYDVAIDLYDEYLRRAPQTEEDRSEVMAIVRTLRSLLATLVVESGISAEVWVDDRRLGTAPNRWLVPTGRHIVEIRAELYEGQRREIQVAPGQVEVVRFEPQRLSTYEGPGPGYFWAALGVTGVALFAGAASGLEALAAREEGRQRAAVHLDTRDDSERTRRWALSADASFGAATLFGATAAVLYFMTDWSGEAKRARQRHATCGPYPTNVSFGARGGPGATFRLDF